MFFSMRIVPLYIDGISPTFYQVLPNWSLVYAFANIMWTGDWWNVCFRRSIKLNWSGNLVEEECCMWMDRCQYAVARCKTCNFNKLAKIITATTVSIYFSTEFKIDHFQFTQYTNKHIFPFSSSFPSHFLCFQYHLAFRAIQGLINYCSGLEHFAE